MKKQRLAFTLVEVTICLALIAVVFAPFTHATDKLWKAYQKTIQVTGDQIEIEGLAYRVQSTLENSGPFQIMESNRGARWSKGRIEWVDGELLLHLSQGTQSLAQDLRHFSLHKREGQIYLTLIRGNSRSKKSSKFVLQIKGQDA